MDQMRKPFYWLAVALLAIAVLIEVGNHTLLTSLFGGPARDAADIRSALSGDSRISSDDWAAVDQREIDRLAGLRPPGQGIRTMALLDGILLLTLVLIGVGLFSQSLQGRLQGCVTVILMFFLILGGIVTIIALLALVILMLTLLLSVPFGTIAYFAIYGFFDRGTASAVLSLLMLLKLGSAASLIAAQQRFLGNLALVLLIITSLVANIIVSFLHGLVPSFLVSITDGIAGIIVAVLAVIWALVLLILSLPGVLRALRPA